jgi:predicted transposase/invertase (TIGR01784 family)
VSLKDYSEDDLVKFEDALSLFMMFDKIHDPGDLRALGRLPENYIEKLSLNIPPELQKLLADTIATILTNVNIPKEEIDAVTDKLYGRTLQEMFTWIEGYDVQATRKEARKKGRQEGKREGIQEGKRKGIQEGKRKGIQEGKREGIQEGKREIALKMKRENMDASRIAALTGLTETEIQSL